MLHRRQKPISSKQWVLQRLWSSDMPTHWTRCCLGIHFPSALTQSHAMIIFPRHYILHELLKLCEATSHHVGSGPCPVLGFFKLKWSDSLKCLYCERHQCLVPGEQIWTHLSRWHTGSWLNITRSTVFVGFLGHIQQCYPVIPYQHIGDIKNKLPDFLQEPLSSIPVIQ